MDEVNSLEFRSGRQVLPDFLSLVRASADWLESRGEKLWESHDVTEENILTGITPDDLYVAYLGGVPVGTMIVQWEDTVFWPHIPAGVSGFVHKLATSRDHAGQGIASRLLDHASELCRQRGIGMLRLDTDASRPKLRQLYERNGFVPVGTTKFRHFEVVLFERKVEP